MNLEVHKSLTKFQRGLMGTAQGELYLIEGYGKDVLSRPIPSDSLSIVRAVRSDGAIMALYGLRSRSASYRFTSPSCIPTFFSSTFT